MLFSHYVLFYLKMCGYIKYFDDSGKNMSFVMNDKEIYEKYNEIWNKSIMK